MGTSGEYGTQVFEILPEGQEESLKTGMRIVYIAGTVGIGIFIAIAIFVRNDGPVQTALIAGLLAAIVYLVLPRVVRQAPTRATGLKIDIGSIAWVNGTREILRISRSDVTAVEEGDESIIVRTSNKNRRITIRRHYFAPSDLATIEQEIGRWKETLG